MQKPYVKPVVSKVEVDAQIVRMFTRKGFIEVFREELCKQRKTDHRVSEKEVFDYLNERFYKIFGAFRYSSYNSFRQRLND
jgi:hypothetical protein